MQLSQVTLSGFPASASSEPLPVQSLAQLLAVRELQRHQPVISLRQALEQMGYVDAATLDRIQAENPDYLRSQSAELVRRMLLTTDDLEHAHRRNTNHVYVSGLPSRSEDIVLIHLPARDVGLERAFDVGFAQAAGLHQLHDRR